MVSFNLDDGQLAKLTGVDDAQVCDSAGQPFGRFLSEELYRRLLYDWARAQISEEELERRRRTPGGRKLSEILARLQAR
jgi:hypothetical protein